MAKEPAASSNSGVTPGFRRIAEWGAAGVAMLAFALAYTRDPLYAGNANTYALHGLARAGVGFLRLDWLARTAVLASAFDAERSCQESRYAGCYRGARVCTAALVSAQGPDGSCWLFGDGCLPQGYGDTNSQDPACGYATFDNAPKCGQ